MDTLIVSATSSGPTAEAGQLVIVSLALIALAIVVGMIIGNRRANAARRREAR